MKRILGFLMALMICLGVFTLVGGVNTVKAAEDDIDSGTYRNVGWRLTSDYEFIWGNGDEQTFSYRNSNAIDGDSPIYEYRRQIKSIKFDGIVHGNGSESGMFYECSSATVIDMKGFDVTNVTDLRNVFHSCSSLVSIENISDLNTEHVTNMSGMFYNCPKLQSLDLSGFDTSNVTDMSCMFYQCRGLSEVNLSSFDTASVTQFNLMFYQCRALKNIDVSNFVTNYSTNISQMFQSCDNLEMLDISGIRADATTNMSAILDSSNKLRSITLGSDFKFRTDQYCSIATPSGVQYTGKWIHERGQYGPYTASELKENYISEMAGTWVWEMKPCAVFSEDGTLSFIRPTSDSVYTSGQTGTVHSISGGEYTGTIFAVNETSTGNNRTWASIASQVKKIQFVDEVMPQNISYWFDSFSNCTEMDLAKLNTSNVTNMDYLFNKCGKLTVLDVSTFNTESVVSMDHTFNGCSSLLSIDASNFDVSHVTNFSCLFNECYKLESINVSGWNTSSGKTFNHMFNGPKVEELDLSSFDTTKGTFMNYMLVGLSSLKSINLGDNFTFKGNNISSQANQAILPVPSSNVLYTGKWIRNDKAYGPFTPEELRDNYTSEMAGTWIWELAPTEYTISFEAGENGTGAMASVNAPSKEDFTLPKNQFVNFGYDFDHWIEGKDGNKSYIDTIPANTYQAGDTVTLTAVWKKRDTSVTMQDGTFTFNIKAGEKATFNDIPAGTSYQVYELTPDGWVLVQQENASGVIEALEESAAAFWNQYQPGVTTVQFSGLKTLDGHPASEGSYKFELLENGKVIDTATTQDGGFIQFKVIEYDAAGDHTYTIREVEPDDDSVDYDTHEETVNVKVTDDGAGNLSSEVTYDDDGIKFENHTRPGILRITKNANVTEANKDDTFTFEITFSNENGMPISDNIYWYVEDQN